MIHVVAQQVASAAQLNHRQRVGVLWIEVDTAVVGRCHAAAKLACEVRVLLVALGYLFLLLAQSLGGYGRGTAERLEVESLVVVAGRLLGAALPKAVGIVAIQGQHLAVWHWRAQLRPPGARVERQVEANVLGHALQSHEVAALAPILVVELRRNHRAAVLPLESLYLSENLAVEKFHIAEKRLVLVP